MNGIPGVHSFNPQDSSTEATAAEIAPGSLARFQNSPSRKITVIPGVKKPVNSWMNWNACSLDPTSGRAVRMAIAIAATAAIRPIRTSPRSWSAAFSAEGTPRHLA